MENYSESISPLFPSQIIDETNIDSPIVMTLGDRMKMYECNYDKNVPNDHYFCIRSDGHGFSKFTKGFVKPYDERFIKAMVICAYDALCEFNARTAFCQSDEITLIFNKSDLEKKQTHMYNGRVQKLVSLVSSFISVRFNFHLKTVINEFILQNPKQAVYSAKILDKINNYSAYFDSRILSWDEKQKYELSNHMIWRSNYDCHRNSIQTYAYHAFGPKKIHGMNGERMIKLLETEKNIFWENDIPFHHKYGIYIKKQLVNIETEYGPSQRGRIAAMSIRAQSSPDFLEFLLSVYYHQFASLCSIAYATC